MKHIKQMSILAFFLVFGMVNLPAADTTGIPALPVELKYAGNLNDQPLIHLNFTGSKTDNIFNIVITDESGHELYNANVKGEVFTKQFLLNTNELGTAILEFKITSKKTGKKVAYNVSRQVKVAEQMAIVKL